MRNIDTKAFNQLINIYRVNNAIINAIKIAIINVIISDLKNFLFYKYEYVQMFVTIINLKIKQIITINKLYIRLCNIFLQINLRRVTYIVVNIFYYNKNLRLMFVDAIRFFKSLLKVVEHLY